MKIIKLKNSLFTKVDDEDFEYLMQWNWNIHDRYVVTTNFNPPLYMHRLVSQARANSEIDHINGDKLDNRRSNLRVATPSQNSTNKGLQKNNKSGFKGVVWHKASKRWAALIEKEGVRYHLGYFRDLSKAVRIYDAATYIYHGDFARPNLHYKDKEKLTEEFLDHYNKRYKNK